LGSQRNGNFWCRSGRHATTTNAVEVYSRLVAGLRQDVSAAFRLALGSVAGCDQVVFVVCLPRAYCRDEESESRCADETGAVLIVFGMQCFRVWLDSVRTRLARSIQDGSLVTMDGWLQAVVFPRDGHGPLRDSAKRSCSTMRSRLVRLAG